MERVTFLHEETGTRIGCMLNPESLVMRRHAGVVPRQSAGGLVTGTELTDDQIMYMGGGVTELDLDLLFDVSLAGSSVASDDVRDLIGPLWEFAENQRHQNAYGVPPRLCFFWGKWNMPGIVVAVAERLEHFTSDGIPQRSWLRMKLRRISAIESEPTVSWRDLLGMQPRESVPAQIEGPGITPEIHEITGGSEALNGTDEAAAPLVDDERLDQIVYRYYGDASLWRLIAIFNRILDPLHIAAGQLIELPTLSQLDEAP